jgi:hypothetical protein
MLSLVLLEEMCFFFIFGDIIIDNHNVLWPKVYGRQVGPLQVLNVSKSSSLFRKTRLVIIYNLNEIYRKRKQFRSDDINYHVVKLFCEKNIAF